MFNVRASLSVYTQPFFCIYCSDHPSDTTPPTPTTSSEVSPALTTSTASPSPTPATIPTIVPPVTEAEDNIEVVNVVMNNMENYLPTDVEDVEAR